MARTFTWLQPVTGNFDGPGSWADITSGTPVVTLDVPTTADIAEFNSAAVTVGTTGNAGAGTIDLAQSVVSLIGTVQFGALSVVSSTLDIGPQGTLACAPADQASAQIAVEVAANAVLAVAGAGALLTVQDPVNQGADLQVAASGTLSVGAGGSVTADVLDLAGDQTAADAAIDAGSSTPDTAVMLDASWLAVGDGGAAALAVQNGALAEAGIVTVGYGEIGGAGDGSLLVANAGQLVDGGYAAFGYAAGDVGVATIEGVGSTFASAGLFVGNAGTGSVTVQGGATLSTGVESGDTTAFAGAIANVAGATGTVLATGVGSTWALAGRLDIGTGGPGTLDVSGGAAVTSTAVPVALISNGATEYEGAFSLVQATVAVDGAGSALDADGGPIYVGNLGTASLSVAQGATASAAAPAPDYAAMELGLNGGTGTLAISGTGSGFTVSGQLDVGGGGGSDNAGTLEVTAAATLQTGGQTGDPLAGLSLGDGSGSSGEATIDGTGTLIRNSGRLDIGRYGDGVLSVSNGAMLSTQLAPSSQAASVLLGVNQGANGIVYVNGSGAVLATAQDMIVGLGGAGTLQVFDSGQVQIATNLGIGSTLGSAFAGGGAGLVSVAAGTISVGGSLALGQSDPDYVGNGTLAIATGAQVAVAGSATITAGSSIALTGGGLEIGGTGPVSGIVVSAGATLAGAGSVQGSVVVRGTIAATGGVLTLTAATGPGVLALAAGATLDVGSLSRGTIDFVGNGTLRLHGTTAGTALLVGLDGGTIDLVGISAQSAVYNGGSLVVSIGTTEMSMALAATPPAGGPSVVSDGAGGTDVLVPCFAAGTRLAAPEGPVAVEAVRAGDLLLTAAGASARVVWVGRRTLDCGRHPRPADVYPVRVRAGALAPGVPGRDVLLSPDHALLVEGSLIPVRYLLNGTSIVQEAAARITYCHVELAAHDVLLAEGLAAESYLDTGNRPALAAGGEPVMLHPEFSRPELARAVWAEKGCAPLVLEGPALERARRQFLRRAAALGHRRTSNPALRVLAGSRALRVELAGQRWQVDLPARVVQVRLASRIWVPAHMRPRENDTRVLGVAVARLTLDGREVALDSPALAEGWLAPEMDWRWTDGAGVVPVAGARVLAFDLAMTGEYWVKPAASRAAFRDSAAG